MIALIAASIVGAGFLGPHMVIRSAPTPASPRPSLAKMDLPGIREQYPIYGLHGLAQLSPAPFDLLYSVLPSGIGNRSLAALGSRLFYIVDDKRVMSTEVGWSIQPTLIATAPACHTVDQVAAAGNEIAYVLSWPIGMPLGPAGCGSPSTIAWSIWLLDLGGGAARLAAAGVRSGAPAAAAQKSVHVALSGTAFAFDRPDSATAESPADPRAAPSDSRSSDGRGGEAVEVHSVVDGSLLWSTRTDGAVEALMLGGSRLAVLESSQPAGGALRLGIASPGQPDLRAIASPVSTASISDDGSYLAWDVADDVSRGTPAGVEMLFVDSGTTSFVAAQPSTPDIKPLQPVVSSVASGPIVAWRATADGGFVYPAFRTWSAGNATAVASAQTTAWLSLQGTLLIWIAAAVDGSLGVAFAIDLAGEQAHS